MTSASTLHVAVLLIPPVQLLDTSPVDLFGMLSKQYLTACKLPAPLTALGLDVVISYVSESGAGTMAEMTANASLMVTANLTDNIAKPGSVDILLIPGPDPAVSPSKAVQEYIRSHVGKAGAIMTVCTGIFPAAHSGVLKGKTATGPRALVPALKKTFPDTKWVEKRWTKDGAMWCSAGITNGQDMVAAYIREKWAGPLAETVCAMADVGDRGVEYPNGKAMENAWWVWQILKAWISGMGR